MLMIKNALISISRSKARNILIGIIVLVIAVSSCIALSIREAAESARKSGIENLEVTAQISVNRQAMMENIEQNGGDLKEMFQQTQELPLSELQNYATSNYVKDFYYTISSSLNGNDSLEAVTTQSETDTGTTQQQPEGGMVMPGGNMNGEMIPPGGMGSQGDFTVIGYSSYSAMTSFVDGSCKISDGEIFDETTSDTVCIISDELAAYNEVSVGDTITLVNPNNEEETYSFTVTGIYTNSESAVNGTDMRGFQAASDPANQIYTTASSLQAILDQSNANAETSTDSTTGMELTTALRSQTSGTYVFSNVESYENFQQDVTAMGLSDDYTVVSTDVEQYEQSLVPLQNLSKFASYFVIVVLIIGGIILVVFSIFQIRERKYEIGVLTAIGMKKWKVAIQFIMEMFTVTLAAILIGTGIGAVLSVPTTNALLETQVTAQQEQQTQQQENFGMMGGIPMEGGQPGGQQPDSGVQPEEGGFTGFGQKVTNYVDEISSATNMTVVLELMGICILLTIVSSCVAVGFVMRYEPLKILTNRV